MWFALEHESQNLLYPGLSMFMYGNTIANFSAVKWDSVTMYHLSVGKSENVYTLALITTDKWYSVYTIAHISTVNCDGGHILIYLKV